MARKFDKSSAFKSIVGADQLGDTSVEQLSSIEPEQAIEPAPTNSGGFQVKKPSKKNVRNHHLHILVTPTTAKQLDQKCKRLGISRNEVINQLIEEFLKQG